jgi:ATP-dependent Lhr-like helicase
VIFPKFRGDLVACAAVTRAMHDGDVEATRYPRNPLDIVAQQIVAMAAMDTWDADELFATIRRAAPFAELSRSVYEGVLDMLSGRYPSDEFAELRPRITWDRVGGTISGRENAKRVAVINGGTIPDRGLYGVFLVGAGPGAARVGELDEEMVFESRPGETFVLGASSWRIEEITHDRVLVSKRPAGPARCRSGRATAPPAGIQPRDGADAHTAPAARRAIRRLARDHDLDDGGGGLLHTCAIRWRRAVPTRPRLIERVRDELGDWRVCVLAPGRPHPRAGVAAAASARSAASTWRRSGATMGSWCGFRCGRTARRATAPAVGRGQALVVRQLGATRSSRQVPRERRPFAAAAGRRPDARAALAAAQAFGRSARGRVE